eukprot:Opistho-2@86488
MSRADDGADAHETTRQPLDEAGGPLAGFVKKFTNVVHVGARAKSVYLTEDIFNNQKIKEDIIRMMVQYLQNEGYNASKVVLQDEASVKLNEIRTDQSHVKRMRKALLEGDWPEVEKLCTKSMFRNYRSFLYSVYKQQYLEHIERSEHQKAFTFLTKRIKPLESIVAADEFRDLCYLLVSRSITDAPSFKDWEGIQPMRERLVEQFQSFLEFEAEATDPVPVPPNRLLTLLRQAVAYQIEFSRYHPKMIPEIESLLHDFTSLVVPNAIRSRLVGHTSNVKCVAFAGEEGHAILSGGSDSTVRVWLTESAEPLCVLAGHTSRVWDVSSNALGDRVVSASGDSTVRIWALPEDLGAGSTGRCVGVLEGHASDVYSARFHPRGTHIVTGGYDRFVRLYDARTAAVVKAFAAHELAVSQAIFNPHGNLIISGSKDSTIRFWDIVSGLCIKTVSANFGEITSVDVNSAGNQLLIASKDNSNRLVDMRMMRPIRRFRGHQNTSKNFVRACFGPSTSLITGGSEDGIIYTWDVTTGHVLQRLSGHSGVVYSAVWNNQQSMLASCSDGHDVLTWWYDQSKPLVQDEDERR